MRLKPICSKRFFYGIMIIAALTVGCAGSDSTINDISLSRSSDHNSLRVFVAFSSSQPEDAYVEYWVEGQEKKVYTSAICSDQKEFNIALTNLRFNTKYQCRVVLDRKNGKVLSEPYSFSTQDIPDRLVGLYHVSDSNVPGLPLAFTEGAMLVYNRVAPGFMGLVDHQGALRWYHTINESGVKVAHFTPYQTVLAILAPMDYPTSYGNEILEVTLAGDTVFHLKKGEKDFNQTIHHEILRNDKNQYVTLSAEERVVDLSRVGGDVAHTVMGDGILVLDQAGKKIWSWSVFDALDPSSDKNILNEANDWMHANSLYIDKDGHYIISFYNNGQVWKVNSENKEVIWKFGKGGDYPLPDAAYFDHGHAVHINAYGNLMLFDNGTSVERSRSLTFSLNEKERKASLEKEIKLPEGNFTDRMGSSYLLNDRSFLTCLSKQNTILLTDDDGNKLWSMMCANSPYRVEFVPFSKSRPYIDKL